MKDKEKTKRKLIWAVGEMIRLKGFTSLSASKVARKAEVDRKLINRYFGGLMPLIEAYVVENDYWLSITEHVNGLLESSNYPGSKELITSVLQNQFRYFFAQKDMQRIIMLELTSNNPLMKSIHHARESKGQKLLAITDPHFKNSGINFRAIEAIVIGGIYYTILHTMYNGGIFADLDIVSEQGQLEIIKAIGQIIEWAYKAAEQS